LDAGIVELFNLHPVDFLRGLFDVIFQDDFELLEKRFFLIIELHFVILRVVVLVSVGPELLGEGPFFIELQDGQVCGVLFGLVLALEELAFGEEAEFGVGGHHDDAFIADGLDVVVEITGLEVDLGLALFERVAILVQKIDAPVRVDEGLTLSDDLVLVVLVLLVVVDGVQVESLAVLTHFVSHLLYDVHRLVEYFDVVLFVFLLHYQEQRVLFTGPPFELDVLSQTLQLVEGNYEIAGGDVEPLFRHRSRYQDLNLLLAEVVDYLFDSVNLLPEIRVLD